jgi:CBS domain-containing protein
VHGVADVYAAGDITSFPVKHGGLATQQALAAAEMIAANAGCDVDPKPFHPVVHGLLLTGRESRFLRRELGGQPEHEPVAAYEPLWWPPAKIVGRHIGPFLASLAGGSEHSLEKPEEDAVSVEVSLGPDLLANLDVRRFPAELDDEDEEAGPAGVSAQEVVLVAPEDTLGEIAEHMLEQELSAVLVSEYGQLIGILTIHDLMSAFAARAHPSEARARQWMTAEPVTIDATTTHSVAARLMRAYDIHHLPLVEHDRPVGMLHLDLDDADASIPIGLGF